MKVTQTKQQTTKTTKPELGPIVNSVITSSMPLNRNVKSYWIRKYRKIATNCGLEEAGRKFKHLRQVLMAYKADTNRRQNLDKYLKLSGFRTNGFLHAIFTCMDCQPGVALNFLKLYTATTKGSKSVDQAACETNARLKQIRSIDTVPEYMKEWFSILGMSRGKRNELYYDIKYQRVQSMFMYYVTHHSVAEWMAYWNRWFLLCLKGFKTKLSHDNLVPVFPEIYKDFDQKFLVSNTLDKDFGDLVSLHLCDEGPLSPSELDFIDQFLNESVRESLDGILMGEDDQFSGIFRSCTLLSGHCVGSVHHIPKGGAGTELRDIAVPNRFIQLALTPGANRLYNVVKMLPNDATYDQNKFDAKISNRVNNPNLYQGSVDLSKATDNLPASWGYFIIDAFIKHFGICDFERQSLELFKTVAGAGWEDEGFIQKWSKGQPLGSVPSFAMLALTHCFFIESLALKLGLGHSPYVILGDDIVIFNKKLRKRYIASLTTRHIPLSLHKSFEGELSEFAGKIYIKNNVPFYCSDHKSLTWNSLFDYQTTTGIRIPWRNLPISIKRKIFQLLKLDPSRNEHTRKAASLYALVQELTVHARGTAQYPLSDKARDIAGLYFEELWHHDDVSPSCLPHSGIIALGTSPNGKSNRLVTLMDERFADKHGYFQRFRPVQLPKWYKDKVRPCTADKQLLAMKIALTKHENAM